MGFCFSVVIEWKLGYLIYSKYGKLVNTELTATKITIYSVSSQYVLYQPYESCEVSPFISPILQIRLPRVLQKKLKTTEITDGEARTKLTPKLRFFKCSIAVSHSIKL